MPTPDLVTELLGLIHTSGDPRSIVEAVTERLQAELPKPKAKKPAETAE